MNRLIAIFIITGSLFLFSCANSPKPDTTQTKRSVTLPDDFWDFLDEFHGDIEFQKAHIQWPLEGLPSMMDSSYVEETYRWSEQDWIMHHDFDETNEEFELAYTMFGDDVVIEQILHINGTMGMERRFSKQDDSWKLIYYAGMNFIRK